MLGSSAPDGPAMTGPSRFGYAFVIALPPQANRELRRWAAATPGASWDASGGHVTLARLTGDVLPRSLVPRFVEACGGYQAFEVKLCVPVREPYWDKPGLEIVMLAGSGHDDVSGLFDLRRRLVASMPGRVHLLEGGASYLPHITLTTGLSPRKARALERAASGLELRFTAHEVVYWSGAETAEESAAADLPWRVIHRLTLPRQRRRAG
jgi:hypothetical protein